MESKSLDIMGILLDIKNIQIITLKRIEMLEKNIDIYGKLIAELYAYYYDNYTADISDFLCKIIDERECSEKKED